MTKEKLESEIENLNVELQSNKILNLRAREDIQKHLDKALEYLEKDDTPRARNNAAHKIGIARQRIIQAEKQKKWLAYPIALCMAVFIGIAAWWIAQEGLWPKGTYTKVEFVLMGSVLWGTLGAAVDGLRELHTRIARQELDANRLWWYFAHPVIGAGLGGILFLVVSGGLLMTDQEVGEFNPSLPLILSALSGFEQQHVVRYLRDVVKNILRIEEPSPDEGG
ncbi:MAG: hypothetical protein JSV02_00180 [Dehalococcoidia bacterium]|nr:MAG: hypothetical protein JSV02_00180 [Dehalococcoidia bacterium]